MSKPLNGHDLSATQDKVERYTKRFINVFQTISNKENVPAEILLESMKTAYIVSVVANIVEQGANNHLTVNDLDMQVRAFLMTFTNDTIGHFEYVANEVIKQIQAQNAEGPQQ